MKSEWMATDRIKTRSPFKELFPIREETAGAIAAHMQENGYDQAQPIILWDQTHEDGNNGLYVIDGHTRLVVAKLIDLSPVYVAKMTFDDEEAALKYAVHNQRDRRNITDAELFCCIEAVDSRKAEGRPKKTTSNEVVSGRSAERTAEIVGTSRTKVEKARTVLDHADDQTKHAVLAGEKSIHKAYKETQAQRKKHITEEERKLILQSSPAFTALNGSYRSFWDDLISFKVDHENTESWEIYLAEIYKWILLLKKLTQSWGGNLEKKGSSLEI